jgi:tetratricopeptide (TPR) repeat protein
VDKSFLQSRNFDQLQMGEVEPRFTMLETIREYALKRLAENNETPKMLEDFSDYFLALAEEAEPKIREVGQVKWLDLLEVEHSNLRTALAWLIETGAIEKALRLAGALWWFWNVRGYLGEGVRWLEQALEQGEGQTIPPAILAKALHGEAALLGNLGRYNEARALMEKVLVLRRELGDKQAISICLHNLGVLSHYQDDYPLAVKLHEESLAFKRELGYNWGIAHSLDELGTIACLQGEYQRAEVYLTESRDLFLELGDKYSLTCVLSNLGRVFMYQTAYAKAILLYEEGLQIANELGNKELIGELLNYRGLTELYQGRTGEAGRFFERGLALFEELQQPLGISYSLTYLGLYHWKQSNLEQATGLLKQGLELKQGLGRKEAMAWDLEGLAGVAFERQQFSRVVLLLSTAAALRTRIKAGLPAPNQAWLEPLLSNACNQLGLEDFERIWQEGQLISPERLVEVILTKDF